MSDGVSSATISATPGDDTTPPNMSASSSTPVAWSLYSSWQRWGFLTVLFLVTTSNYFDYFVLSVLLDPIKHEFGISDTLLGILSGLGFALVYAAAGLPVALWADYGNRRTIITLALAGWSTMTAACGLAHSFWQLAAARFGVGAFEPGAAPPAQSLIIDYFPPERRSIAIAILTMGASAVGYLSGVSVGGLMTAAFGWRSALLFAGGLGLLLAMVCRLSLAEPRSQLGFPTFNRKSAGIGKALASLRRKRSFVLVLAGQSICTIFAAAASLFFPSFMIRSLHASLTQVSGTWGLVIAAADLIGGLLGGWLGDFLGKRDIRWYAWLAAFASAIVIPIYWLALEAHQLRTFIAFDFLAELLFSIGLPAAFSAVHAVCGNRHRAVAIAMMQLCFYLIGIGIGPLLAGALSDAFSSAYGTESLRYSLIAMLGFLPPATITFAWAGQTMRQDREDF